jgi:hypothetical protein
MAAGEIRAGRAYVELGIQDKFTKQLDDAAKKLKSFGDSIANIGKQFIAFGGAITGALLIAAQRFAVAGDQIAKVAQKTGIGVEALQQLKYAAEESGASFEDLAIGIKKMQQAIFAAEGGSVQAKAALAGIGLSVDQLKKLSPDQQFLTIAKALGNVSDAGARTATVMEIFGKGGTALLPLFSAGADGIEKLTKKAESLGLVMSATDIGAATKLNETLKDLYQQMQAVTYAIGAAIAQAIQPFATASTTVLAKVIQWIKENRTLVISLLAASVAITGAGIALVGLGLAIKVVGTALAGIQTGFKTLGTLIGLLTNPALLVVAGLALMTAWFLTSTEVGAKVMGYLETKFSVLEATAKEAFGGIADALAAGDITLAAKILWTGLQLAFAEGTHDLRLKWLDFKNAFIHTSIDAFYGALNAWQTVKALLETAFSDSTAYLGNLWDGFIGVFTDLWNSAVNIVHKGLNDIKGWWDESFDAEAANKAADALLEADKKRRRDKETADSAAREAARKAESDSIEASKKAAIDANNNNGKAINDAADANDVTDANNLKANEIRLKNQLDDMRKKAAEEKKKKDEDKPVNFNSGGDIDLDNLLNRRKEVESPAAKSQGLFNARGVQALQTGSTVEYQRLTAKYAEQIAKNTKNGGARFS